MCWFSVWSFSLNHRSTLRSIESKRECLVSLRKCVREIKSKYSKCPVNKLKGDVNVFMYLSYFQVAAQFCLQEASLQFYEAETELNMFLCPPGSLFQGNENVQNITHLSPKHLNEQFSWKLPLKTSFHFSSRFWCDWQILQAIGPFWISSGYSLSEMSVSTEPNFWRRGSRWTWTPSITATRYFYLLISPRGGRLVLTHIKTSFSISLTASCRLPHFVK